MHGKIWVYCPCDETENSLTVLRSLRVRGSINEHNSMKKKQRIYDQPIVLQNGTLSCSFG